MKTVHCHVTAFHAQTWNSPLLVASSSYREGDNTLCRSRLNVFIRSRLRSLLIFTDALNRDYCLCNEYRFYLFVSCVGICIVIELSTSNADMLLKPRFSLFRTSQNYQISYVEISKPFHIFQTTFLTPRSTTRWQISNGRGRHHFHQGMRIRDRESLAVNVQEVEKFGKSRMVHPFGHQRIGKA